MFPLSYLDKRSSAKEYMDMPVMKEKDILASFRFIRFVNRYGGGHRIIIKALDNVLRSWPKSKLVEIVDVGCGAGDMALAISEWGKKWGFDIRYKGIDKSDQVIQLAKSASGSRNIEYITGDMFDQNIPEADFVMASMVFHHLTDEEIPRAIANLLKKSRHALIINDLTRSRSSYFASYILTRFFNNEVCRNDAFLSIRKGFRIEEIEAMLNRLNLHGVIKTQFSRFLLVIPKGKELQ